MMANIKELINKTAAALEHPPVIPEQRSYMGVSLLGHHCPRYVWLTFRWAFKVQPLPRRVNRIFQRGHDEEPRFIAELNRIGVTVSESQNEIQFVDGHVKGHCDGIATGVLEAPKTPHLTEFKTMNEKAFREITKANSVKQSHPQYYVQVQLYMKGFKLKRYLFMSVNKNDESFYVERGKLNNDVIDFTLSKAHDLVYSNTLPQTCYTKTFYKCRWCDAAGLCWIPGIEPEKNCRTCFYSMPIKKGNWYCSRNDGVIPVEFQRKGCDSYRRLW